MIYLKEDPGFLWGGKDPNESVSPAVLEALSYHVFHRLRSINSAKNWRAWEGPYVSDETPASADTWIAALGDTE